MATTERINMGDFAAQVCGLKPAKRAERAELERLVRLKDLRELDRIVGETWKERERLWAELTDNERTLGVLYRAHQAMDRKYQEASLAYRYAERGEEMPAGPEDCP